MAILELIRAATREPKAPHPRCGACRHFRNDARYLETAFPGLTSLSSAFASVRGDDGICLHHERYLSARSGCGDFSPSASPVEAP